MTVTSDAGFNEVLYMITVSGQLEVDLDQIDGTMEGGSFPADGYYSVSSPGRAQSSGGSFAIESDGAYLIDISTFGLQMGDSSEIYYIDENGNYIGVELYTMRLFVNMSK